MFCPETGKKCRPDCVKWDRELQKCQDVVAYEFSTKVSHIVDYTMNMQRLSWKLQMRGLMNDPMIPDDIKEEIQKIQDAVELEKLLKDVGLLD